MGELAPESSWGPPKTLNPEPETPNPKLPKALNPEPETPNPKLPKALNTEPETLNLLGPLAAGGSRLTLWV